MTRSDAEIIRDLRRKLRRWIALAISGGLFSLFTVAALIFGFTVSAPPFLLGFIWFAWFGVVILQIGNIGYMALRDRIVEEELLRREREFAVESLKVKRDDFYVPPARLSDDGELVDMDDDDYRSSERMGR